MADSQIMEDDVCDGLQRPEVGHQTEEKDETTQERRWISQRRPLNRARHKRNYDITPKPHGEEEPDLHHMTGTRNPDFSSVLSSDLLFVSHGLEFGCRWLLPLAVAVAGHVVAHDGFGWLVSCNKRGGGGGVGGGCNGEKRKCVLFDRTPFG